jgi:hypothetical protein
MARDRDDDDDDRRGRRRRRRNDEYDDYDDEYDDYDDDYDDEYDDRGRRAPPNYLVFSILVTLFCCLIGGIIAIIYSAQVNSRWMNRDYAGARRASQTAFTWCWVSLVIGLIASAGIILLEIAEQGR